MLGGEQLPSTGAPRPTRDARPDGALQFPLLNRRPLVVFRLRLLLFLYFTLLVLLHPLHLLIVFAIQLIQLLLLTTLELVLPRLIGPLSFQFLLFPDVSLLHLLALCILLLVQFFHFSLVLLL